MNTQDKKLVYLLIALPAVVLAFFIGMYVGGAKSAPYSADSLAAAGTVTVNSGPSGAQTVSDEQFAPFWKAWNALDSKFVTAASTTVEQRIWGSIKGLAASYGDPYTVFFPPVESKSFQEDISGNFEGVGMEIGIKDGTLTVVTPIKGSPAEKAGVHTGDRILKIDSATTTDLSVDKAVALIRGKKGTTVTILFLPLGSTKTVERKIVRDTIDIPTLETSTKPGSIFVIRLYSFTAQSPDLFRKALREFVLSGSHKLILDLRGNPGGYLDAAWDMASWFLPAGKTVVTEDFGKNGDPKIYRSKGYNVFATNGLKMAILVDSGSASAAEILAGALHEQGVAQLVGAKTFGKGSVQELVQITPETSLKVTIARWLTPNGHNLSHDGLDPDYPVAVTEKDIQDKKDAQMNKAVEILTAAQ